MAHSVIANMTIFIIVRLVAFVRHRIKRGRGIISIATGQDNDSNNNTLLASTHNASNFSFNIRHTYIVHDIYCMQNEVGLTPNFSRRWYIWVIMALNTNI